MYRFAVLSLVLFAVSEIPAKEVNPLPLTTRYGQTVEGYFSPILIQHFKKQGPLDRMMAYDVRQLSAKVVFPKGYRKGAPGWGVYLHVHSGNKPPFPTEWEATLAKHKLIYAAPYLAGNKVANAQRMAATLDTLATLQKTEKLDPSRIVVGGLSGGGALSMELALNHPDRFAGVISHARNVMLKPEKLSPEYLKKIKVKQTYDPRMVFPVEFPYLKEAQFQTIRDQKLKVVFITGKKDFNYEPIEKSKAGWDKSKVPYLIVDQPNMGHTTGNAASLDQALTFIFSKTP